ncbi:MULTISPECIES: ketosynthase chain-length factor [unclassified Streptomyces]|uniref:ketosynthase chain-length factor n=1 Tax=unclassified Streptomyces TaxID=2593676 RepID=UPI002DDAF866|nr:MULTISPECIES: ketosynthase chain-length factor [unclassified Streptomyces]WSA95478.1 ketosynthase chain-length factor [Streptomyces sp. NBC_01795]WSB79894.1 ketosynthase chain-length factor [Streptomyces sp. NBC_01775]WSS11899.1 ketosynthase chain-length factor [Streptomyces sp. NBC_01186]WSS40613.1 ketosynthase chain-length factor [Streptomyces sp. NBC_01187]
MSAVTEPAPRSATGVTTAVRAPVVTGLGIVAPTGGDTAAHWRAVLDGTSAIGRITLFDPSSYPVRLAGQVPGFSAKERVPSRLIQQTDRWTHLGLAAAEAALADAGVHPAELPEYELAVVTASSSGGTEFGQHEMENLYQHSPDWVGAYQSIAWFYAATTGQVSIRHGLRGPCGVLCCEQAGGLDAIGQSRRLIRTGAKLVMTGGTDASLCPYGLTAQLTTGQLSTVQDPARAYLPFDSEAGGYLPGEGGALLVVEDADAAEARGAHVYGRVLGYAAGFDPPPDSDRAPALARTVRAALADAGLEPGQVDVVFADALGVPEADRAEAAALAEVFGPRAVPVTAPKTLTGRLYGGGAALDAATALLALRDQVVPHTVGPSGPAPGYEIDLVLGEPRRQELRTALVVARGYGGFNAALVLGHHGFPAPDDFLAHSESPELSEFPEHSEK